MALTSICCHRARRPRGDQHSAATTGLRPAVGVMGITAGLYDIPLQAFLQDRSRPEARGSIMAAYNFLAFAGMLVASGIYWLLTGPFGLSPRVVFLLGGHRHRARHFRHGPAVAVIRPRGWSCGWWCGVSIAFAWRGRRTLPPSGGVLLAANHVSWADGVLIGLACPRHPRMVAYAKYFESPWLGWFGRIGRIIPIGDDAEIDGRIDPRGPRGLGGRARSVCIFPEGGDHPKRQNRGVSPRISVDYEGYRRAGRAGLLGRAVGEHFQLRGRKVLLEMAPPLALSGLDPLRAAASTGRKAPSRSSRPWRNCEHPNP